MTHELDDGSIELELRRAVMLRHVERASCYSIQGSFVTMQLRWEPHERGARWAFYILLRVPRSWDMK